MNFPDHYSTYQSDGEVPCHEVCAGVLEVSASRSPYDHEHTLEYLTKHLHQQCIQRRESHALDDDGSKLYQNQSDHMPGEGLSYTMKAPICDVLSQLDGNENPDLDVKECLNRLAPLPSIILDTGHVLLYTIDGLAPVRLVEETRTGRLVGKEVVDSGRPRHGECSKQ